MRRAQPSALLTVPSGTYGSIGGRTLISPLRPLEESTHELRELIQTSYRISVGEKDLNCPTSEEFLLRFIRASNNDVQLSYKLVKDYFRARLENPEEFVFGPTSNYFHLFSNLEFGYILKSTDSKGRRILCLRLGALDPYVQEWEEMIQTAALVLEAISLNVEVQLFGTSLIVDCTDFSLRIMKWATPHNLKVITRFLQASIPIRFESILIVNAPVVFNIFWGALKPFLDEKFVEKVSWHKAPYTKLHRLIDPSNLTSWMGGTLDLTSSVKYWYREILDKEEILKEYSQYGYEKIERIRN